MAQVKVPGNLMGTSPAVKHDPRPPRIPGNLLMIEGRMYGKMGSKTARRGTKRKTQDKIPVELKNIVKELTKEENVDGKRLSKLMAKVPAKELSRILGSNPKFMENLLEAILYKSDDKVEPSVLEWAIPAYEAATKTDHNVGVLDKLRELVNTELDKADDFLAGTLDKHVSLTVSGETFMTMLFQGFETMLTNLEKAELHEQLAKEYMDSKKCSKANSELEKADDIYHSSAHLPGLEHSYYGTSMDWFGVNRNGSDEHKLATDFNKLSELYEALASLKERRTSRGLASFQKKVAERAARIHNSGATAKA
nr:hypothetical protein [Candidatus Burarchaeum sp.]